MPPTTQTVTQDRRQQTERMRNHAKQRIGTRKTRAQSIKSAEQNTPRFFVVVATTGCKGLSSCSSIVCVIPSSKKETSCSNTPTQAVRCPRAIFGCRTRKHPSIGVPAKRRSVGSPPKKFSVGSKRARFVGKRSNRAQANGKPLFQAAFLQFSANCDAGAY